MYGLAGYIKERLPLPQDVSLKKPQRFLFMFLTCFLHHCLASLSYINHLLRLYKHFYAISSNIDEVHHKNWLNYYKIDLMNSVKILLSQINLLRWLTFKL